MEERNIYMVVAALIITAIYQTVLNPPGGFFQAAYSGGGGGGGGNEKEELNGRAWWWWHNHTQLQSSITLDPELRLTHRLWLLEAYHFLFDSIPHSRYGFRISLPLEDDLAQVRVKLIILSVEAKVIATTTLFLSVMNPKFMLFE
ncbi:hypothetical protein PIB30_030984 [Stylosanthes scabra]|uniref:PGG domain-containing protein n=1 Tax=Stylosanthes scabra TaxID=79078 RepID=A0ABU6UAH6_9FABA|nr:hypothetical protein [Stylosanthes scabra]